MSDEPERKVEWNGKVYSADPEDLTMGELEAISQRSDIKGVLDMVTRLRSMDHIAWKAIFWAQDRRGEPTLKWDGYDGPTMRVLARAAKAWHVDEDEAEADEGKDLPNANAG